MNRLLQHRWGISLVTLLVIVAGGLAIQLWPTPDPTPDPTPATPAPPSAREVEIRQRFEQGVAMLHIKQYDYAVTAFHWVLQQSPGLPEAHVNMGFALLGLGEAKVAQDYFQSALALRSSQMNAYYGLALAMAAAGDREGARGAMRTFLHLTPQTDPYFAKAQTVLEEWEAKKEQPAETPPNPTGG
ncbi:MAG: hypothetical protein H7836_06830 [Magnetococcus sp. YQC-3]